MAIAEKGKTKAKMVSQLKQKLKKAETEEEKERLLMEILKAEAPYAKYIRPYTQKVIEEQVIPYMEKEEQQSVKFAAAVHKLVIFYLGRKNII